MRRRSSFAATPSMARTSSAKSEVVSTTGSASERRPRRRAACRGRSPEDRLCRARGGQRDDDNVAGGDGRHQLLKLRPLGGRPGDLFAEYLFAALRPELRNLVRQVLGVGRDAGIAVNHAGIVHQIFALEKRNCISGLDLMQISQFRSGPVNPRRQHTRADLGISARGRSNWRKPTVGQTRPHSAISERRYFPNRQRSCLIITLLKSPPLDCILRVSRDPERLVGWIKSTMMDDGLSLKVCGGRADAVRQGLVGIATLTRALLQICCRYSNA